ncbi:MAG: recombinase family protein [Bacillota bacterium]
MMRTGEPEIRVDRVAIYIRWSTEDQGEGTTLDVQMEACRAYIISQGWAINEDLIFVDDGISGGTLQRPALGRLRGKIAAGEVDCVVVYKLDRLSRSVLDMVKLVLDEWDEHCYIKSAREPIDTMTQTGKMFFYQLVSFAEWERSVIKERTFSGKLRRAQEGRNPGITPAYGYRLGESSELVVEPAEAAVVRLIFQLYASGLGCLAVAQRLGELGHPSPTGRHWSSAQISRMLGNAIYVGTLVYGKQATVKGGRRVKSDKPLIVREGMAPAIVERDLWESVQLMKDSRPGVGRKGRCGRVMASQNLLTGLLRCRCGHAYSGSGGSGERQRYRYYYCGGSNGKGIGYCTTGRIRQDLLDDLVVSALLEQFSGAGVRERLRAQMLAELTCALQEARAAVDALDRELGKAKEKEGRLKAVFLEGELSTKEYRELKVELNRQVVETEAKRAARMQDVERATLALKNQQMVLDRLQDFERWNVLEMREKKQLLGQFVRGIVAYRDKETGEITCAIEWRWAGGEALKVVYSLRQARFTEVAAEAFKRRQRGEDGKLLPNEVG